MSARASTATVWERNFREQMAILRKAHGMSQETLAKAVKARGLLFHQTSVSKIESSDRPLLLGEAYVIAEILGTPIDAMTGGAHAADVSEVVAALTRRLAELERAVAAAHRALGEVRS